MNKNLFNVTACVCYVCVCVCQADLCLSSVFPLTGFQEYQWYWCSPGRGWPTEHTWTWGGGDTKKYKTQKREREKKKQVRARHTKKRERWRIRKSEEEGTENQLSEIVFTQAWPFSPLWSLSVPNVSQTNTVGEHQWRRGRNNPQHHFNIWVTKLIVYRFTKK